MSDGVTDENLISTGLLVFYSLLFYNGLIFNVVECTHNFPQHFYYSTLKVLISFL